MRTAHPEKRPGFTLVEMLVVIAIIGILAAILIPTLGAAIKKAKTASLALELKNLANAFEAYKSKYGDYPPDFSDPVAVRAHVKKAFPRSQHDLDPNLANPSSWYNLPPWKVAPRTSAQDPKTLDAAEAIVFWLSSVNTNVRTPLDVDNKHPDPALVIDGPGEAVSFFEFDETRLTDVDNDGWPEYAPKQTPGVPYVYFDGRVSGGEYLYKSVAYPTPTTSTSFGVARPYRSNLPLDALDNGRTQPNTGGNTTKWINPGKFQIISAGLDGEFGSDLLSSSSLYKQFPDPNYQLTDEDEDNLGDFTEGSTIGESVP